MSKQLTFSSLLAIVAMASLAVLATTGNHVGAEDAGASQMISQEASLPSL